MNVAIIPARRDVMSCGLLRPKYTPGVVAKPALAMRFPVGRCSNRDALLDCDMFAKTLCIQNISRNALALFSAALKYFAD